ncbi:hypothetical protein ABPG72_009905 [Tetrahymena utriculariae]
MQNTRITSVSIILGNRLATKKNEVVEKQKIGLKEQNKQIVINQLRYQGEHAWENSSQDGDHILNSGRKKNTLGVVIQPNEVDTLVKLIKQSLQKLYKIYQYHSEFINEVQNSWRSQIEGQYNDHLFLQEEDNYGQNLHFESLTLNMIQNLESFLIKITEKLDFTDCLYNPTKITINNLKQFKIQELFLIFQYQCSLAKPIAYSKQIKIIQSLSDKCPSTINVDNLNIEITFMHQNKNENYEFYQNQKQQIIDLTYIYAQSINLNINYDGGDLEQQLCELKMKFKLSFPEKFLKLFVKKNKNMVEHFIEYEFFNKSVIFLDQNRKKMLASFLPNYIDDNSFLLVLSQAHISEQVIDRILSEDLLKVLLALFNKLNLQNILSNSFYFIMYDLYLDL